MNRNDIAQIIWHRFAGSSVERWKDETHQAEYLDCAGEIVEFIGGIIKKQRERIEYLEFENRLLFDHLKGTDADLESFNRALAATKQINN